MYVYTGQLAELSDRIRQEVELGEELAKGSKGLAVRRIQEWLSLRGHGLVVDGDYGDITAELVARFQTESGLEPTGKVDDATFGQLVSPMREVLRKRVAPMSIYDAVVQYAQAHLAQHPLEVGGQNKGPWVRLYVNGHEGAQWPWCAGFVTFILHQAAESVNAPMPIQGSYSCDELAQQAKSAGLFLPEARANARTVRPGSIFLVRHSDTDWTHTGLVTSAQDRLMATIEGNTNDDGSREGYEVCARTRAWGGKDYITLG